VIVPATTGGSGGQLFGKWSAAESLAAVGVNGRRFATVCCARQAHQRLAAILRSLIGRGPTSRASTRRSRAPRVRRSAPLVFAIFVVGAGIGALIIALSHHAGAKRVLVRRVVTAAMPTTATSPPAKHRASHRSPALRVRPGRSVSVGVRVLEFVDPTRTIQTGTGQAAPRVITTIVRYPVITRTGATGLSDLQASGGPFPLIVFGHGFAVTPEPYSRLLDAWTRAGYVVAAPVFPLENAGAPGGPNEKDLVNQPADMSLVITRLLSAARARSGPFAGLIDIRHVAVTGQSDGGDTALAVAYDPSVRDRRVGAAMILSGAEDPFAPAFAFPLNGPPLLATQGTADTINPPNLTDSFYASAARPKFLLKLIGTGHQPPYTQPGPQLRNVEHITIAFLDYYFKGKSAALQRYISAGTAGPQSILIAEP
jgi:dienelactone hydrolase